MSKIRIAVLAGGWSGEREVSLKGGKTVYDALDKRKYDVTQYDPRDDFRALFERKDKIDLAFVLLHGKFGEDGCIQGVLDILGVPYVGSGVLASAMALNKKVAKAIYRNEGLGVASDVVVHRGETLSPKDIMERLGPLTVVKPVGEGSSLGMSVCHSEEELRAGIRKAFEHDQEVLVEEYIDGREVTCCVLGNRDLEALPLVEIVPKTPYRFFDYEAKYTSGATDEICPARVPPDLAEAVQASARSAHRALQCRVWSRTDVIIRNGNLYLLETNTIPGMTANSLFPLAARQAGMSLEALVERLVELSLELVPKQK